MNKFLFIGFLLAVFFSVNSLAGININTATEQELSQSLKNIGSNKAAAIVEYRNTHGNFRSVDELEMVKGIGKSTIEINRDVLSTINGDGKDSAHTKSMSTSEGNK